MIPQEIEQKIQQIKDLDKRRNRSGVPMDVYRDISGIIADEAVVVIDELVNMISKQ